MVTNIMYHYIRDPSLKSSSGLNFLSISEFKKQLDLLKKNYKALSVKDYKSDRRYYINSKEEYYLLTFDDGYKEHGNIVLEELIKRRMTGIFFIPSSVISGKYILDVNMIHLILSKSNNNILTSELEDILKRHKKEYSAYVSLRNKYVCQSRYDDKETSFLKSILQSSFSSNFRRFILDSLWDIFMSESQNDIAKKLYLNNEDVETMLRHDMVIGGHGSDHVHLSKVSSKKQQSEINASSLFLDTLSKNKEHPKCFSYPYGSYNNFTLKLLIDQEYDLSFTTNPVRDNLAHSDLEIPRLDTNDLQ
ncbi:polysaccharide deacetylase family protein [Akkermansiaceae bacterium]|nr:polysaccharide deacetylase family protein [Akkermansiaceae bacterium]